MNLCFLEPQQPRWLLRLQPHLQRSPATRRLRHEERQNDAGDEVHERVEEHGARSQARGFGVEGWIGRGYVRESTFVEFPYEGRCVKENGKPAYPCAVVRETRRHNGNIW